jgi:ribosomal protein S18 acetylase RimI-like enzyme
MSFSLRTATVDDRAFMERVFFLASRDVNAKQFGWSDAEVEHSASTRSYDFEHTTIIVADGLDQGWQTIVMRKVDEIHIDSIFLLPEAQGRGIGTKIITGLIAEAQAKKFAISVCAVKTNEGARRLYERLGFAVTWSDDHRVCMLFQRSQISA